MPRNYNNFGNRVKLTRISSTSTNTNTPSNEVSTYKDPELIQEFDKQRQRQSEVKTIQISIDTYKKLQSITNYWDNPSYDDIIITMVKHFKDCVQPEYGKYL